MNLFIKISILVIGFTLYACQDLKKKQELEYPKTEKPNIIWLVCEDQSPEFFPFYGDSTVRLPNLEALAEEGLVFDNVYSPSPVCSPTRSSIITGLYPTTLGTHNMRTYNPYNALNQPEIGVPSYSPIVPDQIKCFTEYLRQQGYYCTNNAKEDYNFKTPLSAWDASSKQATWKNRPKDKPFFAVFNYEITHESQIWQKGDDSLFVDPALVPVPPYFPEDSVIRHDLAVNYSNLLRLDRQIGQMIKQLKDNNVYENSYIFFYSDHGGPFPRYKRATYETGTKVPMVVRFPGGLNSGKRNDELISFIDFAPTLLSLAGSKIPDYMQGQAFLGKQRSTTKRQYLYTASDRFDEAYDRIRTVRSKRFKYLKNFYVQKPYALPVAYRMQMPMMRRLLQLNKTGMLDNDERLWLSMTKPQEELYDLINDPQELNNLAAHSAYKDTLVKYRDLVEKWITETGDLGGVDEQKLIQRWLVAGQQPQLSNPFYVINDNKLYLYADKRDASIVWKTSKDISWRLYTEPILFTDIDDINAKTTRIGYQESKAITILRSDF